jgi:PhoH-like ATPase
MIKTYILDTNVLLSDPDSIFNFEDNNVVIPIGVIEELDKFKNNHGELGVSARRVSRHLDALRKNGNLHDGISLGDGLGKIYVKYNGNLSSYYKESNIDLHVIHLAQELLTKKTLDLPCIIVSKDVNLRIRADALQLQAEDYISNKVKLNDNSLGFEYVYSTNELINAVYGDGSVDISEINTIKNIYPNYYIVIKEEGNEKHSALTKISRDMKRLVHVGKAPVSIPISPINLEQSCAFDALLDPEISLVCLSGKAGTGKTLIAAAVGFHLVSSKKNGFKGMLVSRPVVPMGNDLGYLPGDLNEKLDPWMQPIYDAFSIINEKSGGNGKDFVSKCPNIIVEPLTYIRGRSIHGQYMIIDEAQNLSALEIKTIITRAGENTKIVLTGDISQIDNPYIDAESNGLSIVTNKFMSSEISAHVMMQRGVRSRLSEEASNIL